MKSIFRVLAQFSPKFGKCEPVRLSHMVRSDGTTAIATELFRELPVRRVAMIPSVEIAAVKHRMIQLALVNPHISFSLFDAARGIRVLHTPKVTRI
jgi:DNA mismatch repair ATPase MutL